MKQKKLLKRSLSFLLVFAVVLSSLIGCGSNSVGSKENEFTWWIYASDGQGIYYDDYADNSVVQYVNSQYWDTENGGIGTKEDGSAIQLSFLTPVAGSESENFNTMISTGEYPDILDLSVSSDNPKTLYEEGILMDITEYVEKYMPNYLKIIEENPDVKPFVQWKEDDGTIHYYSIMALNDGIDYPWEGTCYRRDWVVKYAVPTEYVWDWENTYVKENGHPEVTPLSEALKQNNLNGWIKNEVREFKADYGTTPEEDYSDNVIFPSGKKDPYTISDWEWMFEAFSKAISDRGWTDNNNAYCTSVTYMGAQQTGDLVSSFGGGTPSWYINNGQVSFCAASDNFKTYLECMNTWYTNGWLDKVFETRASDIFFSINSTGFSQGMVGMWCGLLSNLGTGIRATCVNEEDQRDAFVMGCALPINDVYGTDAQKYQAPDALYQGSKVGSAVGISTKAKEKDLKALFTFLDWTYSYEGAATLRIGLNAEQLADVELNPNIYTDNDVPAAYHTEEGADSRTVYVTELDTSTPLGIAMCGQRMNVGRYMIENDDFIVDKGANKTIDHAVEEWTKYQNTGGVLNYVSLLTTEDNDLFNKTNTSVNDYLAQHLPDMIKNGLGNWDTYVEELESYNPNAVTAAFQKCID